MSKLRPHIVRAGDTVYIPPNENSGLEFWITNKIRELKDKGDNTKHKIGVLTGSVVAGMLAALVLLSRNAAYRRIHERETADDDGDGVPDIYQP